MAESLQAAASVLSFMSFSLKYYKSISYTLNRYRHHSRDVEQVALELHALRLLLQNECRILLQADEGRDLGNMVEDPNHKLWQDLDFDNHLTSLLANKVDDIKRLFFKMNTALKDMDKQLARLDGLSVRQLKGELMKRLRHRLVLEMNFRKSFYDMTISNLRDYNSELSSLISDLKLRHLSSVAWQKPDIALPTHFAVIRWASKRLYEALIETFDCPPSCNERHFGKLYLDADVKTGDWVGLKLALLSESVQGNPVDGKETSCFWLQAIIANKKTSEIPILDSPSYGKVRYHEFLQARPYPGSEFGLKVLGDVKRFLLNDSIETNKRRKAAPSLAKDEGLGVEVVTSLDKLSAQCLGALPVTFTILPLSSVVDVNFIPNDRNQGLLQNRSISLERFLRTSSQDLSVSDQLNLAYRLAIAVLQYHSTPWLRNDWRLHDVSFYNTEHSLLEDALQKLHFDVELNCQSAEPVLLENALRKTNDITGTRNMTLTYLGIALLELGFRQPLQMLKGEQDLDDIVAARRLSRKTSPLGPSYQRIVQKCLESGFGLGNDLLQNDLQQAIYGEVVCPLKRMLQTVQI